MLVASVSAQEAAPPHPSPLDDLFAELEQLQDANLAAARQMAQKQRAAAALLRDALASGEISDPLQQQAAEALVSNALTLASVVLIPLAAQDVAAGAVFSGLLRHNMTLVEEARPLFVGSPALSEPLEQYAALQKETEQLGYTLLNGWTSYAEALTGAEAAGLLPAGSFDAAAKSWTIRLPELTEPEPAIAEVSPTPASDAPPANVAAAASPEPQAVPGWQVMIGDNARAFATAANANPATAARIRSIEIGCHPNGTLRYTMETDSDIAEYLVFANDQQSAEIFAEGNVISGSQAIRMSDVLRLGFESASAASPPGYLMLAPSDTPAERAYFPISGYLEARGQVLDGCLPWEDESAPATAGSTSAAEQPAADPQAAPDSPAVRPLPPVPRPRPANRGPLNLMTAG